MTATFGSRDVTGPGGLLAVSCYGEPSARATTVLVHPINTGAVVWHPVLPLLAQPAVALDLRGHGRSGPQGPFTVEDGYVPDVLAVLDELDCEAVHLVGGSLGGAIALALASLHPDRVLSVTTFGSTLGTGVAAAAIESMIAELEAAGADRYFAELVPKVVGPQYQDEARLLDTVRAAGGRPESVVAAILRAAFAADIRHLVGQVRAPVLAVGGTADPTCPPSMTEEIATATGGVPVILDGVGHLPMVEVPQVVADLINQHSNAGTGAP
ncbi:alpha/beta fold hydrolase [Mycolicibacterium komossense]|uniref:Alpha/beta fold hydrolase n=1 Tax=Mycolicibacterium komossense TaxID=1779 RepID=A0ABT3CIC2_9MYCO|nr:alpha/beta hydrolase [Mycolicibacterium komossense]MCV7229196.1 alpha/beta fold hydrolase [Mycolicibacterium komossense]